MQESKQGSTSSIRRFGKAGIVLSLAFALLLTACGNNAGNAGSTNQGKEPNGGEAQNSGSTASAKMFDETLTVRWMLPEDSSQAIALDSSAIEAIYDLLNVKLELIPVPKSDFDAKKSVLLATDELPDVIDHLSINDIRQYADLGLFVNISDYPQEAADYLELMNAEDRIGETKKFLIDDKIYGFRNLEYSRIGIAPLGMIRGDLLEEQGIAVPQTWDEVYTALLKIKEKHPDVYALTSRRGTNYMLGQFAYPLGSGGFPTFNTERGIYFEPKQDKFIYGPTDPSFEKVVAFFANAYKDGLLDPDYATMDKDQMFQKATTGKLVFVYDNNSYAARVFNPTIQKNDPNARFDLLKPPAYAAGETRAYRYEKDWDNLAVISSKAKEPEKIVKFINWMYSEEGRLVTNFGVENKDYDLVDGKPTIKQEIVDRHTNDPDPFAGIQGELGVGYLSFAKYIDEYTYTQVTDPSFIEMGKQVDQYTADQLIDFQPNWPPFTTEEAEKVKELELKLSNVFNQEIDKFITGKRSLEDWSKLVDQLKGQGVQELEELFNTAYARVHE